MFLLTWKRLQVTFVQNFHKLWTLSRLSDIHLIKCVIHRSVNPVLHHWFLILMSLLVLRLMPSKLLLARTWCTWITRVLILAWVICLGDRVAIVDKLSLFFLLFLLVHTERWRFANQSRIILLLYPFLADTDVVTCFVVAFSLYHILRISCVFS